jgi:hypothetical protein
MAWFVGDDLSVDGVSTPSGGFPSTYIRSTFSAAAKYLFSTSISGGDMYGKAIVFYKGVDVLHTMQRGTNKCNILTRD